jgi:transcriptional regulator with XRE-family HTH domain
MNPVRRLRQQAGVTQQTLALLAGTSQPTIASYEAGTRSPTLDTVVRLAKALGLEATVQFVPLLKREDLRSLAYHRAVARKIRIEPAPALARARRNLENLWQKHPDARGLLALWRLWLELPLDELIRHLEDTSVLARDMRQVTPFAGLLGARERLEILKQLRKQEEIR